MCINVSPAIFTQPKSYFRCSQTFPTPKDPLETALTAGAEEASALMSLSYDRYLKAGDLYEGYEDGGHRGVGMASGWVAKPWGFV